LNNNQNVNAIQLHNSNSVKLELVLLNTGKVSSET